MQSVEIQGLDKVTKALEDMPGAVREARAVVFEEMGGELLGAVQQRIGGSGRVAGVQEYQVGSGKGYVAVRPRQRPTWAAMRQGISPMPWKVDTKCASLPQLVPAPERKQTGCRESTCTGTRASLRQSGWQKRRRSALKMPRSRN